MANGVMVIITGPLSTIQIIRQYKKIFDLDEENAEALAALTKGYAFAFQALGVAYWNNRQSSMSDVIDEFDELLDGFVYKKIWSGLSAKERDFVLAITQDETKVSQICARASMSNGTLSKYRESLLTRGIIESPKYGHLSLALPRFYEIVRKYRR